MRPLTYRDLLSGSCWQALCLKSARGAYFGSRCRPHLGGYLGAKGAAATLDVYGRSLGCFFAMDGRMEAVVWWCLAVLLNEGCGADYGSCSMICDDGGPNFDRSHRQYVPAIASGDFCDVWRRYGCMHVAFVLMILYYVNTFKCAYEIICVI